MPDAISIGPLAIPPAVFSGLIALVAGAITLRLPRLAAAENRHWVGDRATTALFIAFIVWKLWPILTYAPQILDEPILLLRISAGRPGIVAGAVAGAAFLVPGLLREHRRIRPTAITGLVVAIAYTMTIAFLGALSTPERPLDGVAADSINVEVLDAPSVPLHIDGEITVLGFWATWCGPCRAELPVKERFHAEYGDQVRYLAVNMLPSEAGIAAVRSYAEENVLPYPVVLDIAGRLATMFSVIGTPTTVIIAADGTVADRWLGPSSFDRLKRAVDSLAVQQ